MSSRGIVSRWAPFLSVVLVAELLSTALIVKGEFDETESSQLLRISIDFPEEGFVFSRGQQVLVAVKGMAGIHTRMILSAQLQVAHCSSASCGHIVVILNSVKVSRFDMVPNEFGEIRVHVALPELSAGDYIAAVMLVSSDGEELSRDLYEDVGFSILAPGGIQEPHNSDDNKSSSSMEQACMQARVCSMESEESDCSGHGKCARGACICAANWAGEQCTHAILHNNTFLPTEDPQVAPSRCIKALHWGHGARDLTDSLLRTAESRACHASRVLLFETPPHGFGTNVHYISELLAKAVTEGRALVEEGVGPYNKSEFVLPLSACSPGEARLNGALLHKRNDDITYTDPSMGDSHYIPVDFRAYSHGVLWWRSQLVGFIVRPNARLLQMLRHIKNLIGYRHPVLGVQVRRGDSCAHAGSSTIRPPCQSVETYLALAENFAATYGYKQIFLATDDQEVIDQFRQQSPVQVLALPLDRSMFDSSFFIEYRLINGYTDEKSVTRSTLIDLFLLAEADALVAGFGSHFGRIAFELSVYVKGYIPPYASVDYPYCSHFREKRPIGTWPDQFC